MGGSAWAWLGDMELDDTLLGLGASGVFMKSPLALGFLVNAAHCAEKDQKTGKLNESAMYHEKLAFLDTFFKGHFFSILDRYYGAGKARGPVGEFTQAEMDSLQHVFGLEDELDAWVNRVADARATTLHLLISGPLLGRGAEICSALADRVLEGTDTTLVIWMYAGSFNLTHSSKADRDNLRKLTQRFVKRVSVVETTLKSGAWVCDPPEMFWGSLAPVAWSLDDAKKNRIGFDVSTDIQSVNMFFEEYSSPGTSKRGLTWIFERIAGFGLKGVSKLLHELEVRSLITNLTQMVPPKSSSMEKVRKAITTSQDELEAAYEHARTLIGSSDESGDAEALTAAAKKYAELYRGSEGDFLEAGCTEFFPREKPFSGPRLDKRCILRCMAQGKLQGGATADVLVILALVLFLENFDDNIGMLVEHEQRAVCCSFFCKEERTTSVSAERLFQLNPSKMGPLGTFAVTCKPSLVMDEEAKRVLAPVVDATIDAIVKGANVLKGTSPAWGKPHTLMAVLPGGTTPR